MEKYQRTSFIPESPVRGSNKPKGVRNVYILTYVAYVLFFGTILAAAGVFGYGFSVNAQLSSDKNSLLAERDSFNQADMERIRELDLRMQSAFDILNRQVSLTSLLHMLEEKTVRPVQIYGLEYTKGVDNSLNLALQVRSGNFNNALFQREEFFNDPVLAGATISEVEFIQSELESKSDLAVQGVSFLITKTLSTSDIPYTVTLKRDLTDTIPDSAENIDTIPLEGDSIDFVDTQQSAVEILEDVTE